MEAESNLTRPQYLETQTIEKGTVKDNRSAMKGLDAYGPGIYAVGKDIEAGVYFFEAMDLGQSICPFYVYFSKTPDFAEKEIGLWNLRSFIELEEGWYVAVIDACFLPEGEQKAYEPTESEGSSVFGAGEYLVGRDFTPGTYTYEPANGEVFFLEVRDKAIAANEVSWSNHTLYSGERFDMGREECIITLKEGQLFGIAPRAKMRLKNIESE